MDVLRFAQRHQTLSVFLVSFAFSFLIFGNGIGGEFVLDDAIVVQNRGDLKDSSNFFNLFISPYHQNAPYTGLFRPIAMASYALNYVFLSSSSSGFHVINIILHALNSALVALFLSALTKNKNLSYALALIFLVHPLHTEAVTSIVGRAELLAFLWGISALILALKGSHRWSIACFFLALLSKESALAILPIIIYSQRWHQRESWSAVLKRGLGYAAALTLYLLLRYAALGEYIFRSDAVSFVENPLAFASLGERLATACKVLFLYVMKTSWPFSLSADYSYNSIPLASSLLSSWQSIAGLLILVALIGTAYKERESIYGIAAAIFLFPYLIISNIFVPVGTTMGERLMYLPSLGMIILAGVMLMRLVRGERWRWACIVLIALISSIATIDRNRDWLSNEALLTAAVRVNPDAVIARTGLAAINIARGDLATAQEHLEKAQHVYAEYAPLQNLLGIVAVKAGNLQEAEKRYLKAIELNNHSIHAHRNLINLYFGQKNYEIALPYLRQLMILAPTSELAATIEAIEKALTEVEK